MGWFPDIFWLAGEVLLLLLLAFLLGLLIGWLLWGRRTPEPEIHEVIKEVEVVREVEVPIAAAAAIPEPEPEGADDFERRMNALAATRDLSYRDDLKRISGVGPMLEGMLHDNGLFNFYQVANLEDASIDALDARLEAFPGRIKRDNWVDQAKALHREVHGEEI